MFQDTREAFIFFYFSCLLYKFSDLVCINLYFFLVTNNQGKGLFNREGTLPSKKKDCCCHLEVNKGKAQRSEVSTLRWAGPPWPDVRLCEWGCIRTQPPLFTYVLPMAAFLLPTARRCTVAAETVWLTKQKNIHTPALSRSGLLIPGLGHSHLGNGRCTVYIKTLTRKFRLWEEGERGKS